LSRRQTCGSLGVVEQRLPSSCYIANKPLLGTLEPFRYSWLSGIQAPNARELTRSGKKLTRQLGVVLDKGRDRFRQKEAANFTMISPPDLQTIERIVDHLGRARNLLFVTGAGLSADSGLPTYRGVGGLYEGDATEEGHAIEEMLSGEMFREHPDWTWKYL